MIVEIINNWSKPKLTWDGIIDAVESRFHATYCRQALANHSDIYFAYVTKIRFLAQKKSPEETSDDPRLSDALERITKLKIELVERKKIEAALLEQFARWAYNASAVGIDPRQLDAAIIKVDRDASLVPKKINTKNKVLKKK